ncbi:MULTISPECIES: hypothetical protein [unclassified Microbacterium]|uniref:hypothetical protein n=1 Tax=unclassified Microbacterium TaxID=2609290 RepID=UPI000EA8AA8A|nr:MULTISPECIES: hypothetical protein [unclassified Microbacterium]MBT2484809.1 hypothetical protein [Microbacterium sp. ISL-108]RKN67682.1 hypothetical protein D7252_08845 [Microbacterium sp. CGR2]
MTLLTPEFETLHSIARSLDRLPLTTEQRADIFHAWETAPDEPIPSWPQSAADDESYDRYCESAAGRAWRRVRYFRLHRQSGSHYATDLDEASNYESAPTKTEILQALTNAEHLLAGGKE